VGGMGRRQNYLGEKVGDPSGEKPKYRGTCHGKRRLWGWGRLNRGLTVLVGAPVAPTYRMALDAHLPTTRRPGAAARGSTRRSLLTRNKRGVAHGCAAK